MKTNIPTMLLSASLLIAVACAPMDTTPVTQLPETGSVQAAGGSHVHATARAAVVTQSVSKPRVRELSSVRNEPLPSVLVGPFAASDMSLAEVLDAVSYDSGVAFAIGDSLAGKTLSLIDPSKQQLSVAVSRIAAAGDLFWSHENGVLKFDDSRSYAIDVPAIAGVADQLKSAIAGVGAKDIVTSSATGGLVFSASPSVARRVNGVVAEWSNNRSMIYYDAYIFEVARGQSGTAGIGIETLKQKLSSIASTQISEEGNGFTVTSAQADLALDMLLSEINRSRSSRVLSQPTLAVVSGGSAEIDVGSKQQYISSVSTTTQDSSSTNDVQVSSVSSGLRLKVSGEHSGGIISTELQIDLSTLLGFEEFDTGSASLKLPSTAQRTVTQTLMSRPGDTLVLAGVMTQSVNANASGAGSRSTQRSSATSVDELIIVLRPRLVEFK